MNGCGSKTVFCWCVCMSLSMVVNSLICTEARKKCQIRSGCQMALHNYLFSCGPLIHGETTQCSYECKKALVALLHTQNLEGQNFMTCHCNNDKYCETQKRRIEVCSQPVLTALKAVNDKSTRINCSLAELICLHDPSCNEALGYYGDYCRKLLRGEKCTGRCRNSLTILYRQPTAKKLRTCICDGTESLDNCEQVHENTERLCFPKRRSKTTSHTTVTGKPTPPIYSVPCSHGNTSFKYSNWTTYFLIFLSILPLM